MGYVLKAQKTALERCQISQKSAVGITYYAYRYYDPNVGRWINRDPLGDSVFKAQYLEQTYGLGTLPASLLARAKYHAKSSSSENAFLSQQEKIIFADLLSVEEASIHSTYHFVDNNPTQAYDKLGLNRGIIGADGGGVMGRLHWQLEVDVWIVRGGKYVASGSLRAEFGPTGYGHAIGSTFWGAKKGIVDILYQNERADAEVKSSPCQDIAARESITHSKSFPPPYHWVSSNCQHWVVDHFDDGMDEPGIGKCCNPDGTIWKP